MKFIPPLCHSNCRTCYHPSNSHHQTVTQSILPAVLLLSLTFLNPSLALVSSHFWQKRALLYYPAWRRKAQNPLWFPSFYPAFSTVAMNTHTEFFPLTSSFTQSSLASALKLCPSRYSKAHLVPETGYFHSTFTVTQISSAFTNSLSCFTSYPGFLCFLPFD